MATKSIHKNKDFDSKQVTQRFKGVVDTVKKRRVYVVARNSLCGYDLVDYNSKVSLVKEIPSKHLAVLFCDHCNNKNYSDHYFVKAQQVFEKYNKLYNDTTVYSYIAYKCKDKKQAVVAQMRLQYARQQMEQLLLSIKIPV